MLSFGNMLKRLALLTHGCLCRKWLSLQTKKENEKQRERQAEREKKREREKEEEGVEEEEEGKEGRERR